MLIWILCHLLTQTNILQRVWETSSGYGDTQSDSLLNLVLPSVRGIRQSLPILLPELLGVLSLEGHLDVARHLEIPGASYVQRTTISQRGLEEGESRTS